MDLVWSHSQHGGSELLFLLTLANYSNDDGESSPLIATIARDTRVSERTIRRITQRCIESGELHVQPRAGWRGANLYQLHVTEGRE